VNKRVFEDFWFKSIWEGEKKNIGVFYHDKLLLSTTFQKKRNRRGTITLSLMMKEMYLMTQHQTVSMWKTTTISTIHIFITLVNIGRS
jgi:hypothetical protein